MNTSGHVNRLISFVDSQLREVFGHPQAKAFGIIDRQILDPAGFVAPVYQDYLIPLDGSNILQWYHRPLRATANLAPQDRGDGSILREEIEFALVGFCVESETGLSTLGLYQRLHLGLPRVVQRKKYPPIEGLHRFEIVAGEATLDKVAVMQTEYTFVDARVDSRFNLVSQRYSLRVDLSPDCYLAEPCGNKCE